MFLFYSHRIEGQTAHFDEVEMRHCIQVLRNRSGDEIHFTDGLGKMYQGRIISSNKKGFMASILSEKPQKKHPACNIHIAIAPTKNIDRFEWFLEKGAEFGVNEVTPIICSNSERKKIRADRMEKILLSAMKQSHSAFLPKLNPLLTMYEFIDNIETVSNSGRFIAHCRSKELPHLFHNSQHGKDVVVMIGPEGDFSIEEIKMAEAKYFLSVTLGDSRLRTETAGVAAVHIINLKNSGGL